MTHLCSVSDIRLKQLRKIRSMVGKCRNIVELTAHLSQYAVFMQNKITASVNTKIRSEVYGIY
jgi:hypothetical protein